MAADAPILTSEFSGDGETLHDLLTLRQARDENACGEFGPSPLTYPRYSAKVMHLDRPLKRGNA